MSRRPRVCPVPRCPNLTPCPAHPQAGTRQGSTRAWRKQRARILARDDWTCQHCGAPATDVDHIHPVNAGGTDDDRNLQALCADCHDAKPA